MRPEKSDEFFGLGRRGVKHPAHPLSTLRVSDSTGLRTLPPHDTRGFLVPFSPERSDRLLARLVWKALARYEAASPLTFPTQGPVRQEFGCLNFRSCERLSHHGCQSGSFIQLAGTPSASNPIMVPYVRADVSATTRSYRGDSCLMEPRIRR